MADVELAKAYVTVLPSMDGAQKSITDQLTPALGGAGSKAGEAMGGGVVEKLGSALSKFAAPAAAIGAVASVGKAAFDVGSDFDAMYDTIKTGTGATGDALEGLKESAKNVMGSTPADMEAVGQTLADLNTRTGLTGDALEGLSKQFLALDEIGSSMDVNSATGMMNAWGVAGEDMSGKLDRLFTVSQSTGIGMDDLSRAMSANATTMKQLGFSFEDTASMAGLLDKAGLDASGMMSKMSKACLTLAKDGEQPADAYKRIVGEMQGYIDKGDQAAAMSLATDLFGTKGAGQFVQALQTGALSIDDMSASLQSADGAIQANAEGTRDMAESLEIMKNNALTAVEPFASGLFDTVSNVFAKATPYVQEASEWVGNFLGRVKESKAVNTIVNGIGKVVTTVFPAVGTVVSTVMDGALTVVDTVWGGISKAFDTAKSVYSTVKTTFGKVKDAITSPIRTARDVVKGIVDKIKGLFGFEFKWPKIKLPHFTVKPEGWEVGDLLKGKIPSLGIDWYAKGGYFDKPAVIGVGEAGGEYVLNERQIDGLARRIGGGGGNTYIINGITIDGDSAAARAFQAFVDALRIEGRS